MTRAPHMVSRSTPCALLLLSSL